jgi:hypothetical protein
MSPLRVPIGIIAVIPVGLFCHSAKMAAADPTGGTASVGIGQRIEIIADSPNGFVLPFCPLANTDPQWSAIDRLRTRSPSH